MRGMSVLADQLWPKYFPNEAAPSDALVTIGRVIDRLSDEHVAPADLVREVERQLPELTKWVNDHHLLELDESKPLIVRETPPHKRGIAGAGIDAPGPYDASAPKRGSSTRSGTYAASATRASTTACMCSA